MAEDCVADSFQGTLFPGDDNSGASLNMRGPSSDLSIHPKLFFFPWGNI